ncbi:MAG: flippase-like domain-containing protein [Caldilineaceae bacterium]|nr:flippase-like domain-containing protein [Caldilineaceae bacterium]
MNETLSSSSLPRVQPILIRGSRIGLLIALALLTIALLLWLGGGAETLTTLRSADWRLIALAITIHYGGFALRGHRWQWLLADLGHRFPYKEISALLISGWFISALVPARAGDLMRVGALRLGKADRLPVPVADALGSIVLERTLDIAAILGLGAAFGFVILREQLPSWILIAYGLGVALLFGLGVAILVMPALLAQLQRMSSHPLWQKGVNFAAEVVTSLRTLLRRPGRAIFLLGESALIWFCDALLLWLVVLALGVDLHLASAAFVALTVDIFATVPLTPGGMGQIELAYAALLSLLALPVAFVPAAVLLTRAISYWSFLGFSGVVAALSGTGAILSRLRRSNAE